jgi:hypothetical protein
MDRERQLRRRIRIWLGVFIVALVASGLTAFPLLTELECAARVLGLSANDAPDNYTGLRHWILTVRDGLRDTYAKYPFMAYGTDWLAFAHIVIAIFFLGPIVRPESNRWVIAAGMIACGLVVLFALICGPIRSIPFVWRLIDCSFGVFGFIPLWLAWRDATELARMQDET